MHFIENDNFDIKESFFGDANHHKTLGEKEQIYQQLFEAYSSRNEDELYKWMKEIHSLINENPSFAISPIMERYNTFNIILSLAQPDVPLLIRQSSFSILKCLLKYSCFKENVYEQLIHICATVISDQDFSYYISAFSILKQIASQSRAMMSKIFEIIPIQVIFDQLNMLGINEEQRDSIIFFIVSLANYPIESTIVQSVLGFARSQTASNFSAISIYFWLFLHHPTLFFDVEIPEVLSRIHPILESKQLRYVSISLKVLNVLIKRGNPFDFDFNLVFQYLDCPDTDTLEEVYYVIFQLSLIPDLFKLCNLPDLLPVMIEKFQDSLPARAKTHAIEAIASVSSKLPRSQLVELFNDNVLFGFVDGFEILRDSDGVDALADILDLILGVDDDMKNRLMEIMEIEDGWSFIETLVYHYDICHNKLVTIIHLYKPESEDDLPPESAEFAD